jgi:8-oxo-dGTP diphosphatase
MPHIHVTCAIIERNGHALAAQRIANMKLPLKWEFPGGKIESDEEAKACLQREILITPIDCIDLFKLKYVSEICQKKARPEILTDK